MKLKRFAHCAIIISVVMAVFRTVLIIFYMEKNEFYNDTYYLSDRPLVSGFTVLLFVVLAAFTAKALLVNNRRGVLTLSRGAVPVGSLIAAFSLIGTVFAYAATAVNEGLAFDIKSVLVLLLVLLTAVKFLFLGFSGDEPKESGPVDALAALLPILFSVGRLVEEFISTNASPLASSGGYRIVGLAAVLLFFLYEGKACVRKDRGAMFTLFGCLSLLFLLVYSVPNIILHCFGTFTFDTRAAFSIADIGFAVYIAARLRTARIALPE